MWLMFNKMADDERFKARASYTLVFRLDPFRPPAPNVLSPSLPVLKCSALVFL